jgi:hypothetical protein
MRTNVVIVSTPRLALLPRLVEAEEPVCIEASESSRDDGMRQRRRFAEAFRRALALIERPVASRLQPLPRRSPLDCRSP